MKTKQCAATMMWNTVKELFVLFAAVGVMLLIIGNIPESYAQLIVPEDSPENVSIATGGEGSVRVLARTIVNFFLFFLGLVATIMVIYGGVMYVTAGGNDDQVGKAKKVILFSVIGIVVILLSFALINTVLQAGTPGGQPDVAGGA